MEKYQESLDWLFSQLPMFSRVGAAAYKPGLDRSIALAAHFGNPERRWKSIHIAGTNGKGSVSNLIASVLQEQGYKVGLYTSPHLADFRERIRINGKMIPREDVIRFIDNWRRDADAYADKPSFFELTMMMAFKYFADSQVDYAVIETGMGGRLDSTNIITPLLSVITNISWDHAQFLGDTLPKIAGEKAGIIKPGIPVVIGEAEGDVEKVFVDTAQRVGSRLLAAYTMQDKVRNSELREICPLRGDYQAKNINTARVALQELAALGVEIDPASVTRGFRNVLSNTGFAGRWTVMSESPLTICDIGHNEAGLRYNSRQLRDLLDARPGAGLHMVIGFVADKDIDHILPLLPSEAYYYITQAQLPRALDFRKLAAKADALGWKHRDFLTVTEAVAAAHAAAGDNDIIYIGGSTFIVADYLTHAAAE